MDINKVIKELKCKVCSRYYLHHIKNGPDFRCFQCRHMSMTCEEVQKEIASMDKEEYDSFIKDIEDYYKEKK